MSKRNGSAVQASYGVATRAICALALIAAAGAVFAANSAFEAAPRDQRAVTVKGKGDGRADDTGAIQQAIDQAAEKGGGGVVFLPSGRYRISRTILLWPAVR